MRELLPILLVLACPLLMLVMMRGMHGGGDAGGCHRHDHSGPKSRDQMGIDELKDERDELNERIAQRTEPPLTQPDIPYRGIVDRRWRPPRRRL